MIAVSDSWGEQVWIKGFTYREWTCAITGEVIDVGADAYRVLEPKDVENSKLRVAAHVFDEVI